MMDSGSLHIIKFARKAVLISIDPRSATGAELSFGVQGCDVEIEKEESKV
jgi:hypothetical protein